MNSLERDRVLALRLMERALPLVKEEADAPAVASFHLDFAHLVIWNRDWKDAWKLHSLTDLDELPDHEEVNFGRQPYRPRRGTSVDAQGNLLFHHVPDDFAAARTDGERWRWLLEQAIQADESRRNEIRLRFADFLERHYGVETLVYFGTSRGSSPDDVGRHTVHTLAETETIVATATGNRRYELPNEFDFIRIYREIADSGKSEQGAIALNRLAAVFENRRQYPQAVEVWRRLIAQYGPGQKGFYQRQLDRIVQNRGQLYGTTVFPAGRGATVDYRFRNGRKVRFEAHAIDVGSFSPTCKPTCSRAPRRSTRTWSTSTTSASV